MFIETIMLASNKRLVRHSALAIAIAASCGISGHAFAQATTGGITGSVPIAPGESLRITGGAGFNREIKPDAQGRYSVSLPVGTYAVTLMQNGQPIQSRDNVSVSVAGAVTVDFTVAATARNAEQLSSVVVTANAIPPIDVGSTRQSMVIDAKQLAVLPVGRSAEAIALLAPGTAYGAANLGRGPTGASLVSFSGNSVLENAYYINGFNTTDPVGGAGGIALPYFAIAEQQTITSGYGAEYGRSTGGVISQVGQRGSNTWHAGAYVAFAPSWAEGAYENWYYNNPNLTTGTHAKGSLYEYRRPNSDWSQIYDAYLSGPLIKDKLFFYITAEAEHDGQQYVNPIGSTNGYASRGYSDPKLYGKLDWNINESNILELTGIRSVQQRESFNNYRYDYNTHTVGAFNSAGLLGKNTFDIGILKYTSYITDDLTLEATYGKMKGSYYINQPAYAGYDPSLPTIYSAGLQNPAYTGGVAGGITNSNSTGTMTNPAHKSNSINLRIDLDWKLGGGHDLKVGIDNLTNRDIDDGSVTTGPGYYWVYGKINPATYISGTNPNLTPWIDAPGSYPNGSQGYYVQQTIWTTAASVKVQQRAEYILDNWQVTPNLLLNLGLRDDQFTNYNPDGVAYVRETKPQWAPRLGFSWDIFGDSSAKLFGNVGRYYLALPTSLALRDAAGSYYAAQSYTYSGIDKNGVPQGLTLIKSNPSGYVSGNNAYGQPLDPGTVSAVGLKAQYEDQFVLGFQKMFGNAWVFGAQATYMNMGRIIDDVSDTNTICTQLQAQNPGAGISCPDSLINGAILINPGSSNTFKVLNGKGGYYYATVSPKQFGFPDTKRRYYSMELYLEHPWDGKWFGKIDYLFSKSYGTTEGPTQSATGQSSSAQLGGGGQSAFASTQWDWGQLMEYAGGEQANSHRHGIKALGSYQLSPEWRISGTLIMQSGAPNACLGYYGPQENDPVGYASIDDGSYHWCGGHPSRPGDSGRTPWIHPLNLSVDYIPQWAGKHLDFQVQVRNVFNEQKVTEYDSFYGVSSAPSPYYMLPISTEAPRYVQFSASYNW